MKWTKAFVHFVHIVQRHSHGTSVPPPPEWEDCLKRNVANLNCELVDAKSLLARFA